MVIWGIVIGGMLLEIMNPANRLPISKRLIELIRNGLFSLILMRLEIGVVLECKKDNASAVDSCEGGGD